MALATANTSPVPTSDWTAAIRQRRKALAQRLGIATITAMVFSPILGGPFCLGWLLGYFAIQALDLWTFRPVTKGNAQRLTGARRALGWLTLAVNSSYYGSLTIPLWLVGGPMGGICAVIMLTGAATYSIINSPRSIAVLTLTSLPQSIYMILTPVFMYIYGASSPLIVAASVSVTVFMAYAFSVWMRLNAAQTAEGLARIEAEEKRLHAERIMEGRSAFLAAIGHDLRTPISAILTGASQLEQSAPDGTARGQARLISDAGYMMKALLDDLLDHAKLDAGHMTVDVIDFNLRDLLTQTVRLWDGPVRAEGLRLRVEGAATIPALVRGDPMRLRQILNNLVSNAMKFTQTGAITLRLNAWAEEPGGHAILIEVADTGPGMTPDQLSRLFTPFDQTIDGVSATHGGTGLGLAISRQLADLMGGRLTARSRPGQGAAFTLALHLEAAENAHVVSTALDQASRDVIAQGLAAKPQPAPASLTPEPVPTMPEVEATRLEDAPVEEDEGRPMRVLVVDDHDINRRAIQLILQPLGCDIDTAADGMAALNICRTSPFDLIFMDVRMPELDGRETTRRIRAGNGPNARTPIIAVTADTSPRDIQDCTDAGMTYFVPKPITPPMLIGAITHVMTMEQATLETSAAA
jgi:signal transduction histidine kinase/ActR/RegA family two-component response regulator